MLKSLPLIITLMLAAAIAALAQNTNTPATQTRPRTSNGTTTGRTQTTPVEDRGAQEPAAATTPRTRRASSGRTARGATDTTSKGVLAAFNALLDGIRHADVEAVAGAYWNSPQLVLFNNNGTVTRGWEQMRTNRASSYPNMKDVKLEVRDLRVQMLGREGALVSCLWTQSQVYKGTPETASGRMTIVFRFTGGAWKAVHLHTSPDSPEPTRVAPSERNATSTTTP
ncbi:MAG TPA: nuclear transport factor 2 family protein [Pyrinomonadaceae bacterium]|jgi:ketosteroid isomerase-like protein